MKVVIIHNMVSGHQNKYRRAEHLAMLLQKSLAKFLHCWYTETVWRFDWYGARARFGCDYSVHRRP